MRKTKMLLPVGGRSTVNGEQNILKNERNRNSASQIFFITEVSVSQMFLVSGSCPISFFSARGLADHIFIVIGL
jgi:hypothetical protein